MVLMRDERKPSRAVIKKLMGTILVEDGLVKLARQQMVVSGYPLIPNDEEALAKYLTSDDILDAVRDGYAEYFNMDDILDLVAFFKSDVGKKFVACQSTLAKTILIKTQDKAHKAAARMVKDLMSGMSNMAEPDSTDRT
jgi:hypothetical protein